jgi:hypothetical protein
VKDVFLPAPTKPNWVEECAEYGSVDKRHVPGDDGYSCPRLFQLTQQLFVKEDKKNHVIHFTMHPPYCNSVNFSLSAVSK